jgi:TIR domain
MPLVFLSYASEDDGRPDDEVSRGWVTAFDEALRLELRRLKDVKLWRDKRDFALPGAVRDRLSDEIKTADYLLPVLSTDYGLKEYTRFELAEFFQAIDARQLDPGDFIIPLMPRPLAEDQFPPPLSGLKWVSFFETDPVTDQIVPFFEGFGREISKKYWAAVRDVVTLIEQRIRLQQRQEKPSATVYLAQPGNDQINNHWSVANELESKKCRVFPKNPWPVSTPETRSYLSKALDEAQFSIHLLGATPGRERRSGLGELSAVQLDLAAERQKRDDAFRRLIWIPADLKPTDPTQQKLIESLDDGSRLTARDELVRGGLEAFKGIINDELARTATGVP